MNHLPTIENAVSPSPRLPYLGHICAYDYGELRSFPARKGWKLEAIDSHGKTFRPEDDRPARPEERNGVVQAWLYFGTLVEILRLNDVSSIIDQFVVSDKTGKVVDSRCLGVYLERWRAANDARPKDVQLEKLKSSLVLLHDVGDVVDSLLSFPNLRTEPDQTYLAIAESIAILGDSLFNAVKQIWSSHVEELEDFEKDRGRKTMRFCEPATLSLTRMRTRGWCKSSRMMLSRLLGPAGMYLAGTLPRPNMTTGHQECTVEECVAMQITEQHYSHAHVCADRNCGIEIVDRDIIRVIDGRANYIAFSHVWAHGLGNPDANGLPRCQLARLQDLASKLEARINPINSGCGQDTAFWIDTLSIPVGAEYKSARNQAILNLTKTFAESTAVLVVDAELVDVSLRCSRLEIEMRLVICDWMRRIWTLQEALLTRRDRLFWQFREKAQNTQELWEDSLYLHNNGRQNSSPSQISYLDSAFHKRLPVLRQNPDDAQELNADFMALMYALRYRSLSHLSDELICIAPMLGFDRSGILKSKDLEERMRTFLKLWPRIPSYFLFLEGERMSAPGRRWMPTSFVRGLHKSVSLRSTLQMTAYDTRGLYVTCPGLRLRNVGESSSFHLKTGFYNPLDASWYRVRDQGTLESELPETQRWVHWRERLHELSDPAIVLEYPSILPNYIVGVLVDIEEEELNDKDRDDGNRTVFAKFLCRLWMEDRQHDLEYQESGSASLQDWIKQKYGDESLQPSSEKPLADRRDYDTFTLQHVLVESIGASCRWCVG